MNRRTIAHSTTVQGVTLFTGVAARLVMHPAAAGQGITVRRVDVAGAPEIPALVSRVVPESRRTVLSADPSDPKAVTVQTVEHVLSALAGLGVTDARLELSGPEMPMGDGSAKAFVDAIDAAGGVVAAAVNLSGPTAGMIVPAVVRSGIVIEEGGARIEAQANDLPGLTIEYHLSYPAGAGIAEQTARVFVPMDGEGSGGSAEYRTEIAAARTFSLKAEAEMARAMGLFKHLEPKDTLVIGPDGPIDNSYRYPNEPARHKVLDVLGDLALAGRPIRAKIVAKRTGHAQNHAMARALAAL